MRFCSRCGFPLAGVSLLLANDGLIPPSPLPKQSLVRQRMMKEGAILTVLSWGVTFAAMWLWDWGGSLETFAKVGSLIFFLLSLIGLLRFVFAFLFVKGDVTVSAPTFPPIAQPAALPSPQDTPLTDYPLRTNTREMVPRGSVTENTTRLLDEK